MDIDYVTFTSNKFNANDAEGFTLTGSNDHLSFVGNEFKNNVGASITNESITNLQWTGNLVSGNGANRQLTSQGFAGNPAPTISLVAPSTISPGVAADFSFTFSDNGFIGHALWDFGDGLPSTGQNVSHTFAEAGTYQIGLVVWDDTGRAAHVSVPLTIGLAGDFNNDGVVDAADYVAWRNSGNSLIDYATWRANFGESSTADATSTSDPQTIDEARTSLLLAEAVLLLIGASAHHYCSFAVVVRIISCLSCFN